MKNYEKIKAHNDKFLKKEVTYEVKVNQFADKVSQPYRIINLTN